MAIVSIFVLFEKHWLHNRCFGFPKVTQADTDEAIALLRTKLHSLSQLQGNVSQFFA